MILFIYCFYDYYLRCESLFVDNCVDNLGITFVIIMHNCNDSDQFKHTNNL